MLSIDPVAFVYGAWWCLAAMLMLCGIVGTVLPALPGPMLALSGIILGAWIDGFLRVGTWTIAVCTFLAVIAMGADYVLAILGARRMRASKSALLGAMLGTIAGVMTGAIGLLILPMLGAMAGEYIASGDGRRSREVGFATWLGLLLGTAVKLALVFLMLGIFVASLLANHANGPSPV
jgi:uncharacterized protein YqgC (DUF456 family)